MITCERCGKDNQAHYKFCLGCGADLLREAAQPKDFSSPTPTSPGSTSTGGGTSAPPPSEAPCPQCSNPIPANFRFCGTCGYDVKVGAPSFAPPAADLPSAIPPTDLHGIPPEDAPSTSSTSSNLAELAPTARGKMVLIQADGSEGDSQPLTDLPLKLGRNTGPLFNHDSYLSPQHAEFRFDGDQLVVSDLDSLNGVYIRIGADMPIELFDGSVFRIGQEIIRYEAPRAPEAMPDGTQVMGSPHTGYLGRLCLISGRESIANCFPIPPHGLHLGRERGEVIFPDDGYVSGLHCRVYAEAGHVYLLDVGSSNGTFVRVNGDWVVPAGSLILLGQQLFCVDY